jgi:predicted RNA-binding protein with PUA-like domain
LKDMVLLRIGRLSVQPVSAAEWDVIIRMAG